MYIRKPDERADKPGHDDDPCIHAKKAVVRMSDDDRPVVKSVTRSNRKLIYQWTYPNILMVFGICEVGSHVCM